MKREIKEKIYRLHDAFRFIDITDGLLRKHRGHLSKAQAERIVRLDTISINLLHDYPSHLARAYRRIGEIFEEMGDQEKAIINYSKALEINPNIGIKHHLKILDPNNSLVKKLEGQPLFRVKLNPQNSINYLDKQKSGLPRQAPRGYFKHTIHTKNYCAYIKNNYIDFDSNLGNATLTYTSIDGNFLNKYHIDHLVYKFACTPYQSYIATISYDYQLRLIIPDRNVCYRKDISPGVADRSEIKYLGFLGLEGNLCYSIRDTLYLLNNSLDLIKTLQFDIKPTLREKRGKLPRKELFILGLSGNPTNDEIKAAYRKKIFEVHPDLHPNDPKAHEKTIEVNNAYELLTSPDHFEENYRFHVDTFNNIGFFFAFKNQISAVYEVENTDEIFIGYVFGDVILVDSSGSYTDFYKCKNRVSQINEIGRFLYIVADEIIIISDHRQLLTTIKTGAYPDIVWGEKYFVIKKGRNIQLFELNGTLFGEIDFGNNILDIYIYLFNLRVVTAKLTYDFIIQSRNDGLYLHQ